MSHPEATFSVRGTILRGDELHPEPDGCVLVSDGVIEAVIAAQRAQDLGVPQLDYGKWTVLPGLIDTHCHVTLPGDGRDVDRHLLGSSDEELVDLGLAHARQALRGGVTTLRDLGAKGQTGFEVVRRLARDPEPTPRVISCGPVLTRPEGHGWTFGLPIRGTQEAEDAVRRLAQDEAGGIKVMASGGSTPGTEAWSPALSLEELRAVVEEARAWGLPVAAHVSCPAAAERCLDAGVNDLEHLNLWQDSSYTNHVDLGLLQRIAELGVFVGPTLQTPYRVLRGGAEVEDPRHGVRAKLYADVLSNFRVFVELGLRIIAGSDAGFLVTRFDELHLGLRLMVEHGLSERRALRAATAEAAAALGLQSTTGSIKPGLAADLLVVEGDPVRSIDALRNVRAVFVGGRSVPCTAPDTGAQP